MSENNLSLYDYGQLFDVKTHPNNNFQNIINGGQNINKGQVAVADGQSINVIISNISHQIQ